MGERMEYRQFDKVVAIFSPKEKNDLNPELRPLIGKAYTFQASWVIEDGPYEGQWAFIGGMDFAPNWVPQQDLEVIASLGGG